MSLPINWLFVQVLLYLGVFYAISSLDSLEKQLERRAKVKEKILNLNVWIGS